MSAIEDQERDEYIARLVAFDRQRVRTFDADELERAELEAREALRQAIAADPVYQRWIAYRAAHIRRQLVAIELQSAADDLGEDRRFFVPGPGADRFGDVLSEILSREVSAAVEVETSERARARSEAAASGPA